MNYIGQQFGNYRLVQLLGYGGFADVYLGEHIHLKTQAAIKVLSLDPSHNTVTSFLDEARIIARLEHRHIVPILEFGIEGSIPFLVMKYAPNGTLRQRHPKKSVLPLAQVLLYVRQIGAALHYAHEQQVIHLDVKPENILLDEQNNVLLSDFGMAHVIQGTQANKVQARAGTITYMAPEQLSGQSCSESDQYALGIIVYEWLSGSPPFQGGYAEVATQHALLFPPSLSENNPAVSPGVEAVIMRGLAKDPKQRFRNVQAFASALEQAYQLEQPPRLQREFTMKAATKEPVHPYSHLSRRTILAGIAGLAGLGIVGSSAALFFSKLQVSSPPRNLTQGTLQYVYPGHADTVQAVAWSPDGKYLASGSKDQTVQMWDALTGSHIYTYGGDLGIVEDIAWSPDGKYIASASFLLNQRGQTMQVWSALTGRHLFTTLDTSLVMAVAWSPNGQRIVNVHFDGTVEAFDAFTGGHAFTYRTHSPLYTQFGSLYSTLALPYIEIMHPVAWSPDGNYIAAINGPDVQVWDATTGHLITTLRGDSAAAIHAVAWSPDSRYIITGSDDSTVRVWGDIGSATHSLVTYRGHSDSVLAVAWSPQRPTVASASVDRTVQIWNARTAEQIFTYRGHRASVNALTWSPDGQKIASGGGDRTVQVWWAT